MEEGIFRGLVSLLERGRKGVGSLGEGAEFDGVVFEAMWTFYEVEDGSSKGREG
jgi:hypothetical protein